MLLASMPQQRRREGLDVGRQLGGTLFVGLAFDEKQTHALGTAIFFVVRDELKRKLQQFVIAEIRDRLAAAIGIG